MKLVSLHIKGFRCLHDISLNLRDLTVLIGENDAGKSTLLDALDIALNGTTPDQKDYYKCLLEAENSDNQSEITSNEIEIILAFRLDSWDSDGYSTLMAKDGCFYLRRLFTSEGSKTYYKSGRFVDQRLNQNFASLKATEFDELLETLGIKPEGRLNQETRIKAIQSYLKSASKTEDWLEIKFQSIKEKLPIFQRYRAIDYTSPESFVTKTLQTVYESLIFEDIEGVRRPIESLRELRSAVVDRVNTKIEELLTHIQSYYPRIRAIRMDPDIDFTKGFRSGEFLVDEGLGPRPLSRVGDGTKRRILMGTVDWDRATVRSSLNHQTVIRAYDEPDTNLYYEAQRKLFESILQITKLSAEQDYRIQSIVCTHSLLMVDRAPATSINLLSLGEGGRTKIDYLRTDGEAEIEQFLHDLARELGITNTMLFYERCYLIIEGETEENALPLLYRKIYGTSMFDDGIRMINLHGHGAWLPLLQLLGKNRQLITLALLDSDMRAEYETKFTDAGFDTANFGQRCFWAGVREFEDAFHDDILCVCLSKRYPRTDARDWQIADITGIRAAAQDSTKKREKFSEQLRKMVNKNTLGGTNFSKAAFGHSLGEYCPLDQIPDIVKQAFELARRISGVSQETL